MKTKQDAGVHGSKIVKVFNYGLHCRRILLRFQAGAREHFRPHSVQTCSGDPSEGYRELFTWE
jgi:hypothetical protein